MNVRFFALLLMVSTTSPILAQIRPPGPRSLSQTIQIDEVDSATRLQLERAAGLLENELDDALEVYYQLIQESGARLTSTTPKTGDFARYEPLRVQLQIRLMRSDPATLAHYRQRIHDEAERLFQESDRQQREQNLTRIATQFFLSDVADEALLELGDMALERKQIDRARQYWESIHPSLRYRRAVPENSPGGSTIAGDQPLWIKLAGLESDQDWRRIAAEMSTPRTVATGLVYPDSDVPIADVRARLVLASVLSGQRRRAELELRLFAELHSAAEGWLGGRKVNYVEALNELMADSIHWPPQDSANDWTTFGGSARRIPIVPDVTDVTGVAWRKPLVRPLTRTIATVEAESEAGIPSSRAGERKHTNLSVHPIVHQQTVFLSEGDRIRAFNLATGDSLSGTDDGEIYPSGMSNHRKTQMSVPIGTPRYTLTATDRFLLARMGTLMPQPRVAFPSVNSPGSYLVALDRRSLGLVMRLNPDAETESFQGTPIADRQGRIFVAMRQRGVNAQLSIACFDVVSGRRLWRTDVVAADSLGSGRVDEITSNVLTLGNGTVYVNTNLGAVAALDTRSGEIHWLIRYPRLGAELSTPAQRADHVFRDLTPCVLHEGVLYVAPSDCEQLLALDAMAGTILWHTDVPRGAFDAVHLLGVSQDHLLVSGRRLWWIDRLTGELSKRIDQNPFPASSRTKPIGLGRGVLVGKVVLWPARGESDAIYFVDESTGRQQRQPLALENFNAEAGNLVVAGDRLLIATSKELIALKIETN